MARVVSHRGAAGHAIENTLPAFAKAITLGADIAELDVRLTRDGHIIVFHDQDLVRLTGVDRQVDELTLKEIKQLRVRKKEPIPTLQEVIDLTKGKIDLMIELKSSGTPVLAAEAIDKNKLTDQVLVASFDAGLLADFKHHQPRVPIILLFKHYSNFFLNPTAKRVWQTAENLEAQFLGPRAQLVSRRLILQAHARGYKVYAYTVPNIKFGRRLIRWGVDLIGTNNAEWFSS